MINTPEELVEYLTLILPKTARVQQEMNINFPDGPKLVVACEILMDDKLHSCGFALDPEFPKTEKLVFYYGKRASEGLLKAWEDSLNPPQQCQ